MTIPPIQVKSVIFVSLEKFVLCLIDKGVLIICPFFGTNFQPHPDEITIAVTIENMSKYKEAPWTVIS